MDHFAAIDIGSNAVRLFVGYVHEESGNNFIKKVTLTRVPLRLGEEVFSKGFISEEKIKQFELTMHGFRYLMKAYKVIDYRACATSAMREAENGDDVRSMLHKNTGIDIEIIDGDQEADLIFSSFFSNDIPRDRSYLFIDVGGGSTELTILRNGKRVGSRSFKIGTLRLLKDKVKSDIWEQISEWIDINALSFGPLDGIGSGGNINKIFKLMEKRQDDYIHVNELEGMARYLNSMTVEERMDKLQLKPDRADVIAPASEIYLSVMRMAQIKRVFVPKSGLADGIVYQLSQKHLQRS